MFVIAVYDISTIEETGQKRLTKLMKLMRQYLHHTQKSVFEGEISEAKLFELQKKTEKLINIESDYVVFYRIDNKNNVKRMMYGMRPDPNDTLI
jgi:CRISPR-associated protein Cas2